MSRNSRSGPRCAAPAPRPFLPPPTLGINFMGLFDKFKAGLQKTHAKLTHEIKRIVTRSPKLTSGSVEELEAALIGADLGMPMTEQILSAVKRGYESQGSGGVDVFAIASS